MISFLNSQAHQRPTHLPAFGIEPPVRKAQVTVGVYECVEVRLRFGN
jgi:hypothetical protein